MGDHWPWEAKELDPQKSPTGKKHPHLEEETCLLKTSIIGKNCLAQWGRKFDNPVRSLTCLGQQFHNATDRKTQCWRSPNHSEPNTQPLSSLPCLQKAWYKVDIHIEW
jgi:hypothetical protein